MAQKRLAFPEIQELDPDNVVIRYVEDIDTLFIHLYGIGQPGISEPVDDSIFLRLDLDEQRVIGVQIEGFLKRAVFDHPRLLSLAQFADIRPELLDAWQQGDGAKTARMGLLNSILGEWSQLESA